MAECAAHEAVNGERVVEPISVITGDNDYKKFLYYQLKMSIRQADSIDIVSVKSTVYEKNQDRIAVLVQIFIS